MIIQVSPKLYSISLLSNNGYLSKQDQDETVECHQLIDIISLHSFCNKPVVYSYPYVAKNTRFSHIIAFLPLF